MILIPGGIIWAISAGIKKSKENKAKALAETAKM
jgi:hypothetical protein